jgi:hypothetical protein
MTHAGRKGTTGGNSSQHGQRDNQGPPLPSAHLPRIVSVDTPWVAHALSQFTPVRYGRIASVSAANEATQFAGPQKIPYAPVHNSNLLIGARRSILNRHRWELPLRASNFRSDHSSSFASSILHFPLTAPPSLQLCHSINYSSSQHSNLEPGYKRPKSHEWSLPLDFYQSSIHKA